MAYTVDYPAGGVVLGKVLWRRVFETQAGESALALKPERCAVTLIRGNLYINFNRLRSLSFDSPRKRADVRYSSCSRVARE